MVSRLGSTKDGVCFDMLGILKHFLQLEPFKTCELELLLLIVTLSDILLTFLLDINLL